MNDALVSQQIKISRMPTIHLGKKNIPYYIITIIGLRWGQLKPSYV